MRVYQSLVRPRLLGGAEWRLTFLNVMLCLILISGGGLKWWTLALAVFLATGGQWMLRRAAKRDPEWTSVYATFSNLLSAIRTALPVLGRKGPSQFCPNPGGGGHESANSGR